MDKIDAYQKQLIDDSGHKINIKKREENTKNNKGKFIVIEGIDGVGTTTQSKNLKNWLEKEGWPVYLTKEPTSGPAGAQIRLILEKRLSLNSVSLALLFTADRMDHLYSYILPKLENGINVVSDRYYLSTLAYQSLDIELEWLKQINSKCLKPDLTILLDAPVLVCVKRMEKERWHIQIYEKIDKLEKVRENYLKIAKKLKSNGENIKIIDGNKPPNLVQKDVINLVKKILL